MKSRMAGLAAVLAILISPLLTLAQAAPIDLGGFARLPMLDNGRVKPVDTYARETVRFITGSETYQGMDPVQLLLELAFNKKVWDQIPASQGTP